MGSITVTTETEYLHRDEYRTRDKKGKWSEPEIRYANPTKSLEWAKKRHEECRDMEIKWDTEFEGIYGYSHKNCQLVVRQTRVEVFEYDLNGTPGLS